HAVRLDGGSDRITWSGSVWSGAGAITISGGRVTHDGATNTWTGDLTINSSSIFEAGSANSLTSVNSVADGGTLQLASVSLTIDGITGSGIVKNASGTSNTLTFGADNSSGTYDGVMQNGTGTLNVEKSGTGTIIFMGVNTYSGTTTI